MKNFLGRNRSKNRTERWFLWTQLACANYTTTLARSSARPFVETSVRWAGISGARRHLDRLRTPGFGGFVAGEDGLKRVEAFVGG